jgi:hypothetical protein
MKCFIRKDNWVDGGYVYNLSKIKEFTDNWNYEHFNIYISDKNKRVTKLLFLKSIELEVGKPKEIPEELFDLLMKYV